MGVASGKVWRQIPTRRRMSAHSSAVISPASGTTVWTGRALQVGFDDLGPNLSLSNQIDAVRQLVAIRLGAREVNGEHLSARADCSEGAVGNTPVSHVGY